MDILIYIHLKMAAILSHGREKFLTRAPKRDAKNNDTCDKMLTGGQSRYYLSLSALLFHSLPQFYIKSVLFDACNYQISRTMKNKHRSQIRLLTHTLLDRFLRLFDAASRFSAIFFSRNFLSFIQKTTSSQKYHLKVYMLYDHFFPRARFHPV